jgi:hypothetical protein
MQQLCQKKLSGKPLERSKNRYDDIKMKLREIFNETSGFIHADNSLRIRSCGT